MTDAPRDSESAAFDAALAATRHRFDGESGRARDTELRILESARLRPRPRRALWLLPIAAAFVFSAAFADEIGGQLADLKTRLFDPTVTLSQAPAVPATSPPSAVPAASAPEPARAAPTEPTPPPSTPAEPTPSAVPTPPRAEASPPAPTPPASSSAAPSPAPLNELALYKQAHRAHFTDHDYARALAGWDQYLAAAPRGTFALEARYNRAIALQRLGNRAAAIEALRPFADGAYGRYRQEEARQVIEQSR